MKLNIYYHRSNSGKAIVRDYLSKLDKEAKAAIYAFLLKFEDSDAFRKEPHCKKIHKDIFELRIKAKDHYRILYAYVHKDSVLLLHIFKKKTNKIPRKDLELTIKRLKQYEK